MLQLLKEYIFPTFCLGCGLEGPQVCQDCLQNIPLPGIFCCPVCHAATVTGEVCVGCEKNSALSRHVALTPYTEDTLIGQVIHEFKYNFVEDVEATFASLLQSFWQGQGTLFQNIDVILPVPLHPRRYAERGYNQAERIAELVAVHAQKPVGRDLVRSRHTKQQALLSKLDRQSNVREAFSLRKGYSLQGKQVLLVDDVFTTGATLQECAQTILNGGASRVESFSIARGQKNPD